MAAVEHADNLSVREDFFVTFDENTGSSQNKIFPARLRYPQRAESSDRCINCLMPRNYIRKTVKDEHQEEKLKIAICEVLSGRSSIRKAAERYGLAKSTIGSYSKPSTRVVCYLL
ncbi:hypothetical protein OUZ56_018804 [Daphnia magna]|uniref:HTH psq-type domain-containing protein n=1 Tax=Daphnia magna TaxID=35525 RepID=A0ABQ9Z9S5_9CRUS|nr:hypothetical protein OUZ56_018804 [Daphnia magna]